MDYPNLSDIGSAASRLAAHILETPVVRWPQRLVEQRFGADMAVLMKLELLQHTGSFKPRGALLNAMALPADALDRGVTAVSAGNHAAATAFAARRAGTDAKVVMPQSANPFRVALCRELGAEICLVEDVHQAFAEARRLQQEEGRSLIHPFEGPNVALGTGTLGAEFYRQAGTLDVAVVPVGGGGLISGMACAIKQLNPRCTVIGVEPEGADTMHRSFASGKTETLDCVRTIADSLGAPHTAEYSLALSRRFVDELVMVSDDELCRAMLWIFNELKLAVEPAGAAATAALAGPLRGRFGGRRVGLIVCGANIDSQSFAEYLGRGRSACA